jgi:hypothetical protein
MGEKDVGKKGHGKKYQCTLLAVNIDNGFW